MIEKDTGSQLFLSIQSMPTRCQLLELRVVHARVSSNAASLRCALEMDQSQARCRIPSDPKEPVSRGAST